MLNGVNCYVLSGSGCGVARAVPARGPPAGILPAVYDEPALGAVSLLYGLLNFPNVRDAQRRRALSARS